MIDFTQLFIALRLPVLVGALVTFVFSYLWYSVLFSKQWMALSGIVDTGVKPSLKAMSKSLVTKFVMNLLLGIALFLLVLIPQSLKSSMIVGLIAYIGFVFTFQMDGYLWGGKSFKLLMFDTLHNLLALALFVATMYYIVRM